MVTQKTTTVRWIMLSSVVLLLLSSCTSSIKQSIIGRWQNEDWKPDNGMQYEFFKDGTLKYTVVYVYPGDDRVQEVTKWGTYRFLDDDQMLVEIPPELFGYLADGVKEIYHPRVTKDKLVLSLKYGEQSVDMVYVRQ
jgi:hypothetical protein